MRIIIGFLSLFIFCFACQGDQTGANGPVTGTVNMNGRLQEDTKASTRATADQALILRMGEATIDKGEIACLPVVSQDFRNLIGFQFTMRWDSTQLEFQNVRNFGLPGYGPANFGDRFASSGYLSTLWTEATLEGKNIPDGTTLFEVCLKNKAGSGAEVPVRFTDGPTTFEIIAADMGQWKLRFSNGLIRGN
ncbi:hypothetical protein CEQ90_15590 [Lewinellaceae bacterium SD302]|nr:hypothetical protein CEQ90_15590 [Lewinellaceae bacterium SD302]